MLLSLARASAARCAAASTSVGAAVLGTAAARYPAAVSAALPRLQAVLFSSDDGGKCVLGAMAGLPRVIYRYSIDTHLIPLSPWLDAARQRLS